MAASLLMNKEKRGCERAAKKFSTMKIARQAELNAKKQN